MNVKGKDKEHMDSFGKQLKNYELRTREMKAQNQLGYRDYLNNQVRGQGENSVVGGSDFERNKY